MTRVPHVRLPCERGLRKYLPWGRRGERDKTTRATFATKYWLGPIAPRATHMHVCTYECGGTREVERRAAGISEYQRHEPMIPRLTPRPTSSFVSLAAGEDPRDPGGDNICS